MVGDQDQDPVHEGVAPVGDQRHASVTVLSAGLVRLLDARQLRAVIEHEKAHLSQRHYLVVMAFDAWHRSLPWFPIASRAKRQVAILVEMLADDRARRVVDDDTLAAAITLVAGHGASSLSEADVARVARLAA